jgi:ferredoxin-NADP reductase
MMPGETLSASQLSGEFVLPKDATRNVAFIAGGIGITPFRSMLRYLIDTHSTRSAILLYGNTTENDIAYRDLCEEARTKIAAKTIYVISDAPTSTEYIRRGVIDTELIRTEIPDYADRTFYLSGPRSMVVAFERQLSQLGVPRHHIKTDFFPGLV